MSDPVAIDVATMEDLSWLVADRNATAPWVRRCLSLGEYLIARRDGVRIGFLRFSWFWGAIPFMDAIHVVPDFPKLGVGRALVRAWEAQMRAAGAEVLMTSSMSDEREPQAWHRRQGFEESGRLTFGVAQPTPEVFFIKTVSDPSARP